MNTNTEMSREFLLHKHRNGVKLVKPSYDSLETSLAELLAKRMSVYFLNLDNQAIEFNDAQMSHLNVLNRNDLLGHTLAAITDDTNAVENNHRNNANVLSKEKALIFSEDMHCPDRSCQSISVKMPWYDQADKIIGVFGFSYYSDSYCGQSNHHDFAAVSNTFFESCQTSSPANACLQVFSNREVQLITHLMQGKTLKECSQHLGISKRTAEHYFNNMKQKVNVKTRSEFMNYLLSEGYTF